MKEAFLHYLWKVKNFKLSDLKTTQGASIEIINFGSHNHDSGPDFSNAQIKIEDKIWSGNVEMHVQSGEWYHHKHDQDSRYENVILHVVWEDNKEIYYADRSKIPCLDLSNYVSQDLIKKYQKLNQNLDWIPCEKQIHHLDQIKVPFWLKNLTVERLEQKISDLNLRLEQLNGHWEQLFFEELASNFGLRVNVEAFRRLAVSLKVEYIYKHKDQLNQLEALFFGQSSLLATDSQEIYIKKLREEYQFLAHKYGLEAIPKLYWKYARMRPANFPTIRIAQLAHLFHSTHISFAAILNQPESDILAFFKSIKASDYWDIHYRFGTIADSRPKKLGKSRQQIILINTIVPLLFLYGKVKKEQRYIDKSLHLLDLIPVEKNAIINKWQDLGVKAKTAFDSQALLQLKKHYCDRKRCLNCSIGHSILSLK